MIFLFALLSAAEEPGFHAPEYTIELVRQLGEHHRALHQASGRIVTMAAQCEALRGEYLLLTQDDALRQSEVNVTTVLEQARRSGERYNEALAEFAEVHDNLHVTVDELVAQEMYQPTPQDLTHELPSLGTAFPREGVHYPTAFDNCP